MDPTLIYGLGSLGVGLLALMIKYSFKSKCSDVNVLWGCLSIHRDIPQELQEEKMEAHCSMGSSRDFSLQNIRGSPV